MDDYSKMPYGIHKDKQMVDVPEDYLLWLYENNRCSGEVKKYIEENLDTIKKQIAYQEKRKKV
jgi:uncharacterized protein (DUF3820 family)